MHGGSRQRRARAVGAGWAARLAQWCAIVPAHLHGVGDGPFSQIPLEPQRAPQREGMRHPRWKAAERWKMAERWIHLRRVAAPVKAAAAARQLTRRLKLPVLYSIDHDESVRTRKRRHVCRQRRSRRGTKCQPQQHLVSASSQVCPYGEQGVGSVVPSRHYCLESSSLNSAKKSEEHARKEEKSEQKGHTWLLLARDDQVIREDPAKRDAKLAPGPRDPEMPRERCNMQNSPGSCVMARLHERHRQAGRKR